MTASMIARNTQHPDRGAVGGDRDRN